MANEAVTFVTDNNKHDLVDVRVTSFLDTPSNSGSGGTVTFDVTTTTREEIKEARDLGTSGTVVFTDPATGQDVTFVGATLTGYEVNANGSGSLTFSYTGEVPCFRRGTRILTTQGEVAVEDLVIGDLVVTHAGAWEPIRWIGRRSYAGRFLRGKRRLLPIRIKAGALSENAPRRDLFVSPNHAMYLDGVLIPAGLLVNGTSIVQEESVESVDYIHIELAAHNVVWAEGAASETFIDDDSRAIFHNAHEYETRYPQAASGPALFCAPRVEDGYRLEAIRHRIAERAGMMQSTPNLGALNGQLDFAGGEDVCGWAQDALHPEAPVCLDLLVDGVLLTQTLANRYRADLKAAGLGSGYHSFEVHLPVPLPDGVLEVRRSADAALLSRATLRGATLAEAV